MDDIIQRLAELRSLVESDMNWSHEIDARTTAQTALLDLANIVEDVAKLVAGAGRPLVDRPVLSDFERAREIEAYAEIRADLRTLVQALEKKRAG